MVREIVKTFQTVIKDWTIVELFFATILFPYSIIYVGFRMIQVWEE
jgi:hypothetical protein